MTARPFPCLPFFLWMLLADITWVCGSHDLHAGVSGTQVMICLWIVWIQDIPLSPWPFTSLCLPDTVSQVIDRLTDKIPAHGEDKISSWEFIFHENSYQALAQAARAGVGSPCLEVSKKTCGCGTWRHGLVVSMVVVLGDG